MNCFSKTGVLGLFSTLFIVLVGCYTVPETGRKSLNLFPEGTLNSMASNAFSELKQGSKVSHNKQQNEQVKRVAMRIINAAGPEAKLPPAEDWEILVFEDDNVINAFAMSGGKIGVYTGMFKVASTDDALAVVLGHEVAHVSARHSNERVSQQLALSGLGVGLGTAIQNQSPEAQAAILSAYGVGSTLGVALPFSRSNESEADEMGLLYMARAGYDPRAAIPFWEKMDLASKGNTPEFLSTHPSNQTRIKRLQESMTRAVQIYNEAVAHEQPQFVM